MWGGKSFLEQNDAHGAPKLTAGSQPGAGTAELLALRLLGLSAGRCAPVESKHRPPRRLLASSATQEMIESTPWPTSEDNPKTSQAANAELVSQTNQRCAAVPAVRRFVGPRVFFYLRTLGRKKLQMENLIKNSKYPG